MTGRIMGIFEIHPSRRMRIINDRVTQTLEPINRKFYHYYARSARFASVDPFRNTFMQVRYKAVTGLIGLNIAAFLLLNSRSMKARSHVDGLPRADRHFISSRYNLSHGRIWCVPFSIFNHGDSLMQLAMNCFGLAIVGPAVELAFGPAVLISGFLSSGTIGALAEMAIGNHWCRGSSAGVTGLFGMGAFTNPYQILSIWGVFDVRAASLAISIFGIESLIGLLGSKRSEMAHIAHAAGIASSIPILYYLKWFRRF